MAQERLNDILQRIRTAYDGRELNVAIADLKKYQKQVKNLRSSWSVTSQMTSGIKEMGAVTSSSFKKMQQYGQGFRGELLSIALFSMQVKAALDNFTNLAVRSFTDLMEKSNIYGTSVQRLALHWKDLQFVIGSAINTTLEPLMPVLLNIIEGIREWVQTHPELTAKLLIFGGVLAGVAAWMASLGLALFGVITFFGKLGLAVSWIATTAIPWLLVAFTSIGTTIGSVFSWLLGAFTTVGTWIGAVSGWIGGLSAGALALLVAGLVGLGYIIYQIITYGFVGFLQNVWQGFQNLVLIVTEWAKYLGGEFFRIAQEVLNWILDKLQNIIDLWNRVTHLGGMSVDTEGEGSPEGGRAFGGDIAKTGLYRLHAGETVIPPNQNFGGFNITINAPGSDARTIAKEIDRELMAVFNQYASRIGR